MSQLEKVPFWAFRFCKTLIIRTGILPKRLFQVYSWIFIWKKCATISKILSNNEQESRLAMSKNSAQQWTRIIWYCWHQLLTIVAHSFHGKNSFLTRMRINGIVTNAHKYLYHKCAWMAFVTNSHEFFKEKKTWIIYEQFVINSW